MEYTKLKDINEYISKSINPSKSPDTLFEIYSVPSFETEHPECILGSEIASNKVAVQKNDILLCKINPRINRVWIVADESENPNIASSEWIVVRSSEYNPEFLAWYFRSSWFRSLMVSEVTGIGGSLTRAQPKVVAEYPVPVLDKSRQDIIAATLNLVDTVIRNRQRQLKKLDELVKARFVELFGTTQWVKVRADSIMFNMRNGISPSNKGRFPARVLTLSAITQGSFNPDVWKEGIFDIDPPDEKRICMSDFYMCRGNGNKNLVGAGVYSTENRHDLVFPDTVIAASVDLQRICLPYLFHAWKMPNVREQIEAGARTTNGTYKVNQMVISNVEIPLPPIELQNQFAAFVQQADQTKAVVQKALDETQILFDSLMQKYFG